MHDPLAVRMGSLAFKSHIEPFLGLDVKPEVLTLKWIIPQSMGFPICSIGQWKHSVNLDSHGVRF